jgi:hypothetical protein
MCRRLCSGDAGTGMGLVFDEIMSGRKTWMFGGKMCSVFTFLVIQDA